MRSLTFIPQKTISESLQALENRTHTHLHYFGGVIRDQLVGRPARDIDILVFGDFHSFSLTLAAPARNNPLPGKILHSNQYNCVIEIEQQGRIKIDFINGKSFVERYAKESNLVIPQLATEDELVNLAVACSDFTINGCALSVGSGAALITHPRWEQDIRAKTIEVSFPMSLSTPLWPGLKALILAEEIGGTLSPALLSSLQVYAAEGVWKKLPSDLLYRQVIRLFLCGAPLQSAALLSKSGLLHALFSRETIPTPKFSIIQSLMGSSKLPAIGSDGYAPWFIAALLLDDESGLPRSPEAPLLAPLRPEHRQSLQALALALPRILEEVVCA